MKLPVMFRKLHKWLGLVVGIQILAWVLGGLFMTSIPIEQVRGTHLRTSPAPVDWSLALVSPAQVLKNFHGASIKRLSQLHQHPAYVVEQNGVRFLVSASTGETFSPIDEPVAKELAMRAFAGTPGTVAITWMSAQPPIEYREKPLPAWQVAMGDAENTHIYIDALTGEVTALRTGTWRVFDFFWMLHVMDYSTRDNFNHPLIITAAAITLLVLLSGFFMLYYVFKPKKVR